MLCLCNSCSPSVILAASTTQQPPKQRPLEGPGLAPPIACWFVQLGAVLSWCWFVRSLWFGNPTSEAHPASPACSPLWDAEMVMVAAATCLHPSVMLGTWGLLGAPGGARTRLYIDVYRPARTRVCSSC